MLYLQHPEKCFCSSICYGSACYGSARVRQHALYPTTLALASMVTSAARYGDATPRGTSWRAASSSSATSAGERSTPGPTLLAPFPSPFSTACGLGHRSASSVDTPGPGHTTRDCLSPTIPAPEGHTCEQRLRVSIPPTCPLLRAAGLEGLTPVCRARAPLAHAGSPLLQVRCSARVRLVPAVRDPVAQPAGAHPARAGATRRWPVETPAWPSPRIGSDLTGAATRSPARDTPWCAVRQ